jgi:regulator of sirC expression with transglutaminase-like and TPR domain
MKPFDELQKLACSPQQELDVLSAAVLVSQIEHPDLTLTDVIISLDRLAAEAQSSMSGLANEPSRVMSFLSFLFGEGGFRGNTDNYYDPNNSYINQVIENRTGIPITMALIIIEVGKRLNLEFYGIGYPGHFLLGWGEDNELLIDPFSGSVLTQEQRDALVYDIVGVGEDDRADCFKPISQHDFIARMTTNLKHIFIIRENYEDALELCNVILKFQPRSPDTWRDRGLVRAKLDQFRGACKDLKHYLELAPTDRYAPSVRVHVKTLENKISLFH